jgi:hypothetical protein
MAKKKGSKRKTTPPSPVSTLPPIARRTVPGARARRTKRSEGSDATTELENQQGRSCDDIRVLPTSTSVIFARAEVAVHELMSQLKQDPRVHFVDVGYKISGNTRQWELAVRVHVFEKSDKDPIPRTACNGSIRTDVIRSKFESAATSGDGISSDQGGNGTLSMVVKVPGGRPIDRLKYLTCAHVITPSAPIPFTNVKKLPAGANLGQLVDISSNRFALTAEIDAAIFDSNQAIVGGSFDNYPAIYQPTSIGEVTQACVAQELRVYKLGNATGGRSGLIDCRGAIYQDIRLDTGISTKDHFLVRSLPNMPPFAATGDSGSAVVSERGQLLGIVRGVTTVDSDGPRTVVTPISRIIARMGFEVVV